MSTIIIGEQIGEVVENGIVVRKDYIFYCEICLVKRISKGQRLTKDDAKYVKSCIMKEYMIKDKDGEEIRGKSCGRCKQTVVLSEDNQWLEPRKA